MASNYWTEFPERKQTAGTPATVRKGTKSASMSQKQSFTSMSLPGKASDAFAKAKKGFKKVSGKAAEKGL
jgi:hypothetical protein